MIWVTRVKFSLACYLLCVCICMLVSMAAASIVSIDNVGTFEGMTQDVQFKSRGSIQTRKIDTFLGIQYAKPPTGRLRFDKPEIMDSYQSTVNATKFGPLCTQSGIYVLPKKFPVSEDCLYLNIYKPHNGRRLPVMVFVHGGFAEGRYGNGGANFISGDVLAVYTDIIVVTLNYRLGLLGFYATSDIEGVSRGNYGLWDQHTALLWVHRHIESFGGDPDRVTLAGQQTGAVCALYQAMYPGNKGLFRQVIAQSGGPLEMAKSYEGAFTKRPDSYGISHSLGCLVTEFEDTMSCLRNFTHDKLALLMETLRWPVSPAYDGEFIKADPNIMLDPANQIYNDVQEFFSSLDMIIGYNSMDGLAFFTNLWIPKFMWNIVHNKNISNITVSKDVLQQSIDYTVNVNMFGIPFRNETEPSQTILSRYYNILKPDEYRNVIIQFSTDYYYLTPALLLTIVRQRLLEKYKTPQKKLEQIDAYNTYLYKFNAKPGFQFRYWEAPSWVNGAAIGDELPFLFGFSRPMLDSLNVSKDYMPSEEEMMVAEKLMTKWGDFVKTGALDTTKSVDGVAVPRWPSCFESKDSSDARIDMTKLKYWEITSDSINNTTGEIKTDFAGIMGRFWLSLKPYIDGSREEVKKETEIKGDWLGLDVNTSETIIIVLVITTVVLSVLLCACLCCLCYKRRSTNYETVVEMT